MNRYRLIALSAIIILFSCKDSIYKVSRPLLGTIIHLTIIADEKEAPGGFSAVFNEIERIENLMSPYRESSGISRINRLAWKKPIEADREIFSLIEKSILISEDTDGCFDISFASISHLWNFKIDNFIPPSAKEVKRYLHLVNYKNIRLYQHLHNHKPGIKFVKKGMKIGLGGIAKGYVIKRGVGVLRERGVKAGIVEAGGDLQVFGTKFGKKWKTGLRHPGMKSLLLVIELEDMDSIATSGDYERFKLYNKKRYHHIIDPRTGRPTETFCSVSVVSKDPVTSDSYATAIFVMGIDRALEFLAKHKHIAVILVDLNFNIFISNELKNKIELLKDIKVTWI